MVLSRLGSNLKKKIFIKVELKNLACPLTLKLVKDPYQLNGLMALFIPVTSAFVSSETWHLQGQVSLILRLVLAREVWY